MFMSNYVIYLEVSYETAENLRAVERLHDYGYLVLKWRVEWTIYLEYH